MELATEKKKKKFDDVEDKLYLLYNIFRTNNNELIYITFICNR